MVKKKINKQSQANNRIIYFIPIFLILILLCFVIASGSFDEQDTREIGYEYLNSTGDVVPYSQGGVIHLWNEVDDYYFNKSSGIQFTNHFQESWTRNVFCIGYYNGGIWNKIKCADELENFNRNIHTDNLTYINATLWKDIVFKGYDFRLAINYYLGINDKNLSVTIYGKNIGVDIPYDLGFAWKIKDVEIPLNVKNDRIFINNTYYDLDGIYNLTFKNMTMIGDYNAINETIPIIPLSSIRINDYNEFLRINWNENLSYAVKMFSDGNQSNFYISVLINVGHFNPGQEKQTTFKWIDALGDYISTWSLPISSPRGIATNNGTFMWVVDISENTLYKFPINGTVAYSSFGLNSSNNNPSAIHTDGTNIWVLDYITGLYKYDMIGNHVSWFPVVGSSSYGMTTDGTNIWTGNEANTTITKWGMTGDWIGTFELTGDNTDFRSMVTNGNNIWVVDKTDGLVYEYQMDGTYTNNTWSISGQTSFPFGITMNETNFWVVDYHLGDSIYMYVGPELSSVYNLSITDPNTGEPESVSSLDNITLTFDFLQDGSNVTSGVSIFNITIGGTEAQVVNSTVCSGTLDCSAYETEGACNNCSQCNWTTGGEGVSFFDAFNDGTYWSEEGDCSSYWNYGSSTPSGGTGPQSGDSDDAGNNFVYMETSSGSCDGSPDTGYLMYNQEIDWDAGTNDKITFETNFHGSTDIGTMTLEENSTGSWVSMVYSQSGADGNSGLSWTAKEEDASGLTGKGFVRFKYTGCSSYQGDAAIDKFNITSTGGDTCSNISADCSSCAISDCDTNCSSAGCSSGEENQLAYDSDLGWLVNITVPTFASGLKDLYINASYDSNYAWDTETSAIDYAVSDSCSYSSGDWTIQCSDGCQINDTVTVDGSDVIFNGSGFFRTTADISGFANLRIQGQDASNKCNIYCVGGCFT